MSVSETTTYQCRNFIKEFIRFILTGFDLLDRSVVFDLSNSSYLSLYW